MQTLDTFDIIIIGGSYAGMAAAMALGRSLKQVLIIDGGLPCNRQTPHSHNFITHDGKKPADIAKEAKAQLEQYTGIHWLYEQAVAGQKIQHGFSISTASGKTVDARKLIFATGVTDVMPDIPGFAECWGISVLHCPYCHGYEVRHLPTGILGNGDYAYEFAALLLNWTKQLTIYTNGQALFNEKQLQQLQQHHVSIQEMPVATIQHKNGQLNGLSFTNGTTAAFDVLYARPDFVQHCTIPQSLGCALTQDGYLQVDALLQTTVPGIYACGDNTTRLRTVANSVAMGTTAGMMLNKEMAMEAFG